LERAKAKEDTLDDDTGTALSVTIGKDPSLAPRISDMTNAFLVAEQPSTTAIYETNGITQLYAFKASNSDPDTLSYDEAMADVDRELWIAAAKKEIKLLEDHGTWTKVDISETASRILLSQWVFQRKRTPDGNVKSHKGRTVARGILSATAFAVRATYHTTLQKSPGQLVFGRDMIFNVKHKANWEYMLEE
jgi:hypothetical protein